MIISILCVDKNYGIGKKNGLLFNLPLDMKHFRLETRGHKVFLGENTLLSFPGGKPLANREHFVLSGDPTHNYEGVENIHNFEKFLQILQDFGKNEDVYVIGGASIYRQTLPYVDKVLLTKVDADGEAEVFFPNLDLDPAFECIDEGIPMQDGDYTIRFTTYVRK